MSTYIHMVFKHYLYIDPKYAHKNYVRNTDLAKCKALYSKF